MHAPVRGMEVVIKSSVNPRLKIFPSPRSVLVRRPCDSKRVHAVFVLQDMRSVEAVLAAAPRHNAIIGAIGLPMFVAERNKFFFARAPVNRTSFHFREPAGVADAFFVKMNGLFCRARRMAEFNRRVRPLI